MKNLLQMPITQRINTFVKVSIALFALGIAMQFIGTYHWLSIVPLIAGAVLLLLTLKQLTVIPKHLNNMTHICKEVQRGNLDERMAMPIEKDGEFDNLRLALNHAIDSIDGFTREATYTTECNINNQSYRVILEKGLHGTYKYVGKLMNQSMNKTIKNNAALVDLIKLAEDGVSAIGASTEEFTSSIQEIKTQVESTVSTTSNTQGQSDTVNTNMNELLEKLKETVSIVSSIQQITEQTNLLALNASIEAARAGEAGRGFSVVAEEVKKLATETDSATQNITGLMSSIQDSVNHAHNSTSIMNDSVISINENITTIASALEEQSLAANDISQNSTNVIHEITEFSKNN